MIWVLPDGFSPLARPAAALPASFDMPLFGAPVELPVVVPLTEDPAVVPVAAAPPAAEPPPAEPLPDCASAKLPVKTSAVANPNAASFMIAPSCCCIMANGIANTAFLLTDHSSLLFR